MVEFRLNRQVLDGVADRAFLGDSEARRGGRADDDVRTTGETQRSGQREGKRCGPASLAPGAKTPAARAACAHIRPTGHQGVTGR